MHFGGGTPSLLEAPELEEILSCLLETYRQSKTDLVNVTLEANPGDLNYEKLQALKEIGFNRISFGIQTFNSQLLKKLNRLDTPEEIISVYKNIRNLGFDDVSFDLLSAFPGQSYDDMQHDYETALSLEPDQVQAFFWRPIKGKLLNSASNYEKQDYESWWKHIHHFLTENGYGNYCYQLYAKPGKESLLHMNNAAYIRPYIAFGPGAFQYMYHTTEPDIKKYIERESFHDFYSKKDNELNLFRHVITSNLRLSEGLHLPGLKERFQRDLVKMLDTSRHPSAFMTEFGDAGELKTLDGFKKRTGELLFIRKLKDWLDNGTLVIENDYLRVNADRTTPYELWK